jgi:hypothetical protein
MKCKDCHEPVYPTGETCPECPGVPVLHHDTLLAAMLCCGTSPHVMAVTS